MKHPRDIPTEAMEGIARYLELRREVDRRCLELADIHRLDLACRPGCWGCCENLTVFPVEFYAIVEALRGQGLGAEFDPDASCGYLEEGLCVIYPHRPLICRTHGLPIAFPDESGQADYDQVAFCEKNFQAGTGGDAGPAGGRGFDAGNTFDVYAMNCELFAINLDFIARIEDCGRSFGPGDRIALRELARALAARG